MMVNIKDLILISSLSLLLPNCHALASSWTLKRLEPDYVHISELGNATMTCIASTALSKCQFMVRYFRDSGPVIDLSYGLSSALVSIRRSGQGRTLYTAQYAGGNLEAGHCGIRLMHVAWGQYTVACRVRASTGGWAIEEMAMRSDRNKPFNVTIEPRIATVELGGSISILCRSEKPLTACSFHLPLDRTVDLSKGKESGIIDVYRYHGAGLLAGECGITIQKVIESHSGLVWCRMQAIMASEEQRRMALFVINPQMKAATSVELLLNKTTYTEGNKLQATCRVRLSGCLAVNITWFIGKTVVRQDNIQDSDLGIGDWGLYAEKYDKIQHFTKELTWRDNGKILMCKVSPLALSDHTHSIKQKKKLYVKYKDAADVTQHNNVHLINTELCGNIAVNYNIAHGHDAGLNQYPWMALLVLQTPTDPEPKYICGGSIINKNYVLSAAHCVPYEFLPYLRVRLGEYDTSKQNDCYTMNSRKICNTPPQNLMIDINHTIVHPNFELSDSGNYDIALIRVEGEIDFEPDSVRPICLPVGLNEQLRDFTGKMLTLTGWGHSQEGIQSSVLQAVQLAAVPLGNCSHQYRKTILYGYTETVNINNDILCAGGTDNQNQCRGDSGGPLIAAGHNKMNTQYGIVSFGVASCGTSTTPGVFTRVGHFMPWLLDNIHS